MRCDEFEARLQDLLDARQAPERDPSLGRHAQQCRQCHAQLASLARLLEGLDLLEVPPLPVDFAQRVVMQVSRPAQRSKPSTTTRVAVALAATLLIAILPMSWYLTRRSPSVESPRLTVRTPRDQASPAAPAMARSDQPADAEEGWLVPGTSFLEFYPEEVRERHRAQVNQIAADLRPIATPFNAAMAAIRRSIPLRNPPPKGEPRASTQRPFREHRLS